MINAQWSMKRLILSITCFRHANIFPDSFVSFSKRRTFLYYFRFKRCKNIFEKVQSPINFMEIRMEYSENVFIELFLHIFRQQNDFIKFNVIASSHFFKVQCILHRFFSLIHYNQHISFLFGPFR